MLEVTFTTIFLLPTIWATPPKTLWKISTLWSLAIALASLPWLCWPSEPGWTLPCLYLATDPLSSPLLVLSCWLLPLSLLASRKHMTSEPIQRQRLYVTLLTTLQLFLILAFSAAELIMFYVMFEATLLPILFIVSRWGNKMERMKAGAYLLFYTLTGSLPLLIALISFAHTFGTLWISSLHHLPPTPLTDWSTHLLWVGCLVAFLIKLPLFGVHLWLPKAHVEAPIAGSMILAAVLLKLGGYGLVRISPLLTGLSKDIAYPFIALALWGIVMAGLNCLRQTDMKALIAYSSVSHMGLVIMGVLIQTPWGLAGATALMIAHGLVSSALFCLANTSYERTHSRALYLIRGMQMALPLMTTWWFLLSLANLALPPLPNLIGELNIITSAFNWSNLTLLLTGPGVFVTAAYTLHLFLTTQRGHFSRNAHAPEPSQSREHLLMAGHFIPVLMLTLDPHLMWGWCY
nr:NADH dehydrogenase subunit 4 [Idiacanthus fasciola]